MRRPGSWLVVLVCVLTAGAAALWHFTSLSDFAQPDRLADVFRELEHSPWGPAVIVAVFVVGGLVMLPVTLLIAATAIVFEPFVALTLSLSGTLLSAVALYAIGARWMRGKVRHFLGRRFQRIENALVERGVIAVAAVRMVPLAPFTLVNLAAGSLGVRLWDYVLGTALGMAPGILVLSVFGRQVRAAWERPTLQSALVVIGSLFAWLLLSWGLQRVVSRRRGRRQRATPRA